MKTIIRCASGLVLVGAGLVMLGGCGSPEGHHERVGHVHQAAGEFVVINEIDAYPPGSESPGAPNTQRDPWWYVELKGTPGLDLTNYYFVQVVGIYSDSQYGNTGKVVGVEIDLGSACGGSACQLGPNGLLLLRDTAGAGGEFVASQDTDTPVVDGAFDAFWPESNSYLLIHSSGALNPGGVTLDFDPANDGTLTLPTGAQLVDAVGWKSGYKPQDFVYGGVPCAQQDYISYCNRCAGKFEVPAAATRLPGDNTPLSASAWYCGGIAGEQPGGLTYDSAPNASPNLPDGAVLTPGAENYPTSGTGGSSGAGGTAGQGGSAGQGGTGSAGDAGSGGSAGDAGSGGSAGDAGSGGSAGNAGSGGSAGDAGSGGSAGDAGSGGSAGDAGSGGSAGDAGSGGSAGDAGLGGSPAGTSAKEDDAGCGRSNPSSHRPSGALALLTLAGLALAARRRR